MADGPVNGEKFSSLAARLGETNASLLTVCHRIGINIFDPNYPNLELDDFQIHALTKHVQESKHSDDSVTKKKKKKQPFKPTNARIKQDDDDEPRSLQSISEYFDVPLESLKALCVANDIPVTTDKNDLSKNNRRKLMNLVVLLNIKAGSDNSVIEPPENPITHVIRPAKSKERKRPAIVERATTKRISVLAKELNTTETDLRFVIESLLIPIIKDRHDKIEIRHESEIAQALSLVSELPADFNDRGEFRLKTFASHFDTNVPTLIKVCDAHGIDTRHKRYVSQAAGLRLAALLNNPDVLKKLQSTSEVSEPAHEEEKSGEIVADSPINYQGVSLAHQNFERFSFQNSLMSEVDLSHSVLVHTNLQGADATEGLFTRSRAAFSDFSHSTLVRAAFNHADLSNAVFFGADCSGANFTNANLQNVNFTNAILNQADVRWANFKGTVFHNTTWIDGRIIHSYDQSFSE